MSGQPYRYFTDPTKFRTEYMESLGLRADLDTMNYDANKTYKETGQLPAVSQMKDTRSTTDILLDFEKLKIDLISEIAKISSTSFGDLVVQQIISSTLNSDNKLLVFSAQRIDDIVNNLKRIYKYGIKGDYNDAVQFVNFIETMYNDKNAITASTKSFMNRLGVKSLGGAPANFSPIYENINRLGATLINYRDDLLSTDFKALLTNSQIDKTESLVYKKISDLIDYINVLKGLIPKNQFFLSTMEDAILKLEETQYPDPAYIPPRDYPVNSRTDQQASNKPPSSKTSKARTGTEIDEESNAYPQSNFHGNQRKFIEGLRGFMFDYLDFLNFGLPNTNSLFTVFELLRKQMVNYYDSTKLLLREDEAFFRSLDSDAGKTPAMKTRLQIYMEKDYTTYLQYPIVLQNIDSVLETVDNLINICRPEMNKWSLFEVKQLRATFEKFNAMQGVKEMFESQAEQMAPSVNVNANPNRTSGLLMDLGDFSPSSSQFTSPNPSSSGSSSSSSSDSSPDSSSDSGSMYSIISRQPPPTRESVTRSAEDYSRATAGGARLEDMRKEDEAEIDAYLEMMRAEAQYNPNNNSKIKGMYIKRNQLIGDYNNTYPQQYVPPESRGSGIRRRGRPMGCGIAKPISYKESVKAHAVLDKGIMETPRFVKFGKYLVNNHKLHNEDIFALKRMAGGNIVDIPSIKISKNLVGVIKKMLGGAIPTYSDISKLSEPEKAYLHKVSQKSNILDKFDIPAPTKDNQDKDIHIFEVMRGEIMAGNDSKELISKFKTHILKLSRNGTLPKKEVEEILSELL